MRNRTSVLCIQKYHVSCFLGVIVTKNASWSLEADLLGLAVCQRRTSGTAPNGPHLALQTSLDISIYKRRNIFTYSLSVYLWG